MRITSKLAAIFTLSIFVAACAEEERPEPPANAEVLQLAPAPGATADDSVDLARHVEADVVAAPAADHCTVFCTDVHNGTSKGMWMKGNPGWFWIPPGQWSDDASGGRLQDVDVIEVPYGCSITFRLHTYHQYEQIRVHGYSPYVWIVGSC